MATRRWPTSPCWRCCGRSSWICVWPPAQRSRPAPAAFRSRRGPHARLPATLGRHLDALLAPTRDEQSQHAPSDDEPLPDLLLEVLEAVTLALDELHYDLWRDLPAAASVVSAEWLLDDKGIRADVSPFQDTGQTAAGVASADTDTEDRFVAAIASWARTRSDEVAAVVLAGSLNSPPASQPRNCSLSPAIHWLRVTLGVGAGGSHGCRSCRRRRGTAAVAYSSVCARLGDAGRRGPGLAGRWARHRRRSRLALVAAAVRPRTCRRLRASGAWLPLPAYSYRSGRCRVTGCCPLKRKSPDAHWSVSMASEGLLLARGAYRAHPCCAARRPDHRT